jgi:hypothetical protein
LQITTIPFLTQDASASITDSHTLEKIRLNPLTPFFLPWDPFEYAPNSSPEQLSSRFSASPNSPVNTPSHSYEYFQEEVQNVHLHVQKKLYEAPTAEMDEVSDCDMAWTPDVCSRPQPYPSRLSPVSVTMNVFHLGQVAYCEVKKVLINTYNHFTLDLTQFASPKVHCLSFRHTFSPRLPWFTPAFAEKAMGAISRPANHSHTFPNTLLIIRTLSSLPLALLPHTCLHI